jgi:hypothetical protein
MELGFGLGTGYIHFSSSHNKLVSLEIAPSTSRAWVGSSLLSLEFLLGPKWLILLVSGTHSWSDSNCGSP